VYLLLSINAHINDPMPMNFNRRVFQISLQESFEKNSPDATDTNCSARVSVSLFAKNSNENI